MTEAKHHSPTYIITKARNELINRKRTPSEMIVNEMARSSRPKDIESNGDSETSGRSNNNVLNVRKRPRGLVPGQNVTQSFCQKKERKECRDPTRWLLNDGNFTLVARLPRSLCAQHTTKTGQNLDKLRTLFDKHELRTSKISSPREALSIYKDSFEIEQNENTGHNNSGEFLEGKEFLSVTFGLYPHQMDLEEAYRVSTRTIYCFLLFCKRLQDEYINDQNAPDVQQLLRKIDGASQSIATLKQNTNAKAKGLTLERFVENQVSTIVDLAARIEGMRRYRVEEWMREYQKICTSNSTISNAFLYLLQCRHEMRIKDVLFKRNQGQPKYERITLCLFDPTIDVGMPRRPDPFLFLPGLHTILTRGPCEMVSDMIESFWSNVSRNGYFPTVQIQQALDARLRSFFLSGLLSANAKTNQSNTPLALNANFVPTAPLSIYLHGKAGAGKSSLAKIIPSALQTTLEEYVDPECMARFVKQNLNKPFKTLELEFQLRPNNNDMSVMSIVQGRRMTMSQSKPGLVVLNLEEMPMHSPQGDPNQLSVARLISQRFGGRKGDYTDSLSGGKCHAAPRNSDKRSIGKDFSLVTIFSSNYPLAEDSKAALEHLDLYRSLTEIEMSSIIGSDRELFAKSYLRQCLSEALNEKDDVAISTRDIVLDITSSEGDTRPLVRQLRMFAYHLERLFKKSAEKHHGALSIVGIHVTQTDAKCRLGLKTKADGNKIQEAHQELIMGSFNNWYPVDPFSFDLRVQSILGKLKTTLQDQQAVELAMTLEFWLSGTLAPAVVLSRDKNTSAKVMDAVVSIGECVHCIRDVDTRSYKMIRSLYDPREMPNLRDDILKFGRGSLVATELCCPSQDSQLCIREMIEDSPSMTAFSSAKSALYKSGLLFVISVDGEVTPEVLSRVSIVL